MSDHSIRPKGKLDDLGMLVRVLFIFDIGPKDIEVICEHKCFEGFIVEWHLALPYDFHGHLIIKVNIVVFLLDDVCVVVGVQVDGPYLC